MTPEERAKDIAVCHECSKLLSEGLDLCVRARKLDAIDRTAAQMAVSVATQDWCKENLPERAAMYNEIWPDQPMSSKSATYPIWVTDQYERDLADWERRSRHHLMQGCANRSKEGEEG